MTVLKKILEEVKAILRTTAYFAFVFIMLMIMKKLELRNYNIEFSGLSQSIIGALVLAKVVILMKLISLGKWVQDQPPIVDITLRTILYSIGVAIVIVLEKAFEERHEANGFGDAIARVIHNRDFYHVWATTIGVAGSIFVYNSFSVIQRWMGKRGLAKLFFSTPLNQVGLQIK